MVVNRKLAYDVLMGNDIPNIDAILSIRRQPQRSCALPVNYNESSDTTETDDSSISGSEYSSSGTAFQPDSDSGTASEPESSHGTASQPMFTTDTDRSNELRQHSSGQDTAESDGHEKMHHSSQGSDAFDTSDGATNLDRPRKRQTRSRKRRERQLHAHRWGEPVPLEGGIKQLREAQKDDPSLARPQRSAGLAQSPFYYNQAGVLCRQKG